MSLSEHVTVEIFPWFQFLAFLFSKIFPNFQLGIMSINEVHTIISMGCVQFYFNLKFKLF